MKLRFRGANVVFPRCSVRAYSGKSETVRDYASMFGDSFSIESMGKVLDILQNIEKTPNQTLSKRRTFDSNYLSKFTHDFGQQILRCRIINYLNNRPFILSNPQILTKFPHKFNDLVDSIAATMHNDNLTRPQSVFNQLNSDNSLDYYQSIARYYLINETHCLHRLYSDIRHSARTVISYRRDTYYNFPPIPIPPASLGVTHDPLVIQSAITRNSASKARELYILPYLLKDASVIRESVCKYQRFKQFPVVSTSSIIGHMSCQEMEGSLAFNMLCRRILLKSFEERTEKVLGTEKQPREQAELLMKEKRGKRYQKKFENLLYWEDILEQTVEEPEPLPTLSIVIDELPHNPKSKSQVTRASIKKNDTDYKREEYPEAVIAPKLVLDVKYSDINCALIVEELLESKSLMKMKAIIAYKSNIASRLMFSKAYQRALKGFKIEYYSQQIYFNEYNFGDNQIIKILSDHFDRFFGVFYFRSPLVAEKWLVNLLFAFEAAPLLFNEELLKEAIASFKDMITSVQFKLTVPEPSIEDKKRDTEVDLTRSWFKTIRQVSQTQEALEK